MATLAGAPPWSPEDDLLLKNAVEGGASLEALAKGAVRFSRKFTVSELRDRWHSLLYDPIVSAEASARIIELELSAKKSGSGNRNSEVLLKRKSESVRKLYYTMQKRICRDSSILELSDMNYLMDLHEEQSSPNGYMRDGSYSGLSEQAQIFRLKQSARCCEVSSQQKNSYKMFPSTCGDRGDLRAEMVCSHALPDINASYHLLDFPAVHSEHSLWKHIEDPTPGMPMNMNLEDKIQVAGEEMLDTIECLKRSPTKFNSLHDGKILSDEPNHDQIEESGAISDKYLVDISDCLLNLNEDDIVPMGINQKTENCDGQDVIDEKSYVAADSSILNCDKDKDQDDAVILVDAQIEGDLSLAGQGSEAEKVDTVVCWLSPGHSSQFQLSSLDKQSSDTKSSTHFLEEIYEEATICILNTEDPEIPCNDDIHSPITISVSTTQPRPNGSTRTGFPSREKKLEEQNTLKKDEKKPESSSMAYQINRASLLLGAGPNYHLANAGGNFEVSSNQCTGVVLKEAKDVLADMDSCRLPAGSPGPIGTPVDKSSAFDLPTKTAENSNLYNVPEMDRIHSKVDYEQDESDSHIPNFSDIEAMILDMDLWPKDWDSHASKEVLAYKSEEARKAVMRMEQCARSCIQRAIGSRGALAVLYGRHSKHYIRKAEVMLGRSTNDFDVDIDLVKEGGTNRISRRQALIKLENEGSFSLKNLGKNSMFLNGKEVFKGQGVRLTPSCLIEVKGIAFVFEMNQKSVRQYLWNLARESRKENNSFEWSPEGTTLGKQAVRAFPT
ncbi:hypothetical protein SAY86_009412 [Trapa natans]|uniref:FHA domain-containing protein n=1 Tax=Trapa natans TaxID=22666 RepID=A0AAN7KVZ2_TRANT|nr:hypothetical protein SAY86_009412 [Trapa natans]